MSWRDVWNWLQRLWGRRSAADGIPSLPPGLHRQQGVSIIQVVLGLGLASFAMTAFIPQLERLEESSMVDSTRASIEILAQSAIAHYTDEANAANYRFWPNDPGDLIADDYLTFFQQNNPWGNPYEFRLSQAGAATLEVVANAVGTCRPAVVGPPAVAAIPCANTDTLVIQTAIPDDALANAVVRDWATFSNLDVDPVTGVTTVQVGIPSPGQELSHDRLLPLDGSRPMDDDATLDFGADVAGNDRDRWSKNSLVFSSDGVFPGGPGAPSGPLLSLGITPDAAGDEGVALVTGAIGGTATVPDNRAVVSVTRGAGTTLQYSTMQAGLMDIGGNVGANAWSATIEPWVGAPPSGGGAVMQGALVLEGQSANTFRVTNDGINQASGSNLMDEIQAISYVYQ